MYKISHIFDKSVELTYEQKQQIDEAFDSAVTKTVEKKEEEFEAKLAEEKEILIQELEQQNEEFLKEHGFAYFENIAKTAATEFMTENAEPIEAAAKNMLSENLLSDISNIFRQYGVKTPESTTLADKLDEANSRVEALMIENRQTQKLVESLTKDKIIAEVTANLTESQYDKVYDELQDIIMLGESQYRGICQSVVAGMFGKSDDKSEDPKPIDEGVKNVAVVYKF